MQRPDVTDAEIVNLILSGKTGVEIAHQYGFTDATVIYRVKRATGMKPSELRRKNGWIATNIPPEEVTKILDLYQGDDYRTATDKPYVRPTLASVARETGHAPETIRNILKNQKIEIGGPGHRAFFSDEQKQQIADLYSKGQSCPQLAEQFGVNEITIRRTLKAMGVPRRPRGRPPISGTPTTTS